MDKIKSGIRELEITLNYMKTALKAVVGNLQRKKNWYLVKSYFANTTLVLKKKNLIKNIIQVTTFWND